jgi:small subunit ribosomal protein S20
LAHHKSAKKRARQSLKRRARNRHVRSRISGVVKTARNAIASGEAEAAGSAVHAAERTLRKAASKGVISKKQASRRVSRLAKRVSELAQS